MRLTVPFKKKISLLEWLKFRLFPGTQCPNAVGLKFVKSLLNYIGYNDSHYLNVTLLVIKKHNKEEELRSSNIFSYFCIENLTKFLRNLFKTNRITGESRVYFSTYFSRF